MAQCTGIFHVYFFKGVLAVFCILLFIALCIMG